MLFVAALGAAPACQAAEAANAPANLSLVETGGQRMRVDLHYVEGSPDTSTGRFTTGQGGCSGTLAAVKLAPNGELTLAETLEAGKCAKQCQLVLSADLSAYRETCRGGAHARGRFDTVAAGSDIVARLAGQIKERANQQEAEQQVREAAYRVPCWACNIVQEGLLAQDLVGSTVYERDGDKFFPVTITAVDRRMRAVRWRQESSGKAGTNDANVYYTEHSKGQLEATLRVLAQLKQPAQAAPTAAPGKPGRASADASDAKPPTPWISQPFASPAQAEQAAGLAAWVKQNPFAKVGTRSFFEQAGVSGLELVRALASSGMNPRDIRASNVFTGDIKMQGNRRGSTYMVAFCSAGRPWCSPDRAVGEAILAVSLYPPDDKRPQGAYDHTLWMMNQTGADPATPFYCTAGADTRFYCPQKFYQYGWRVNAPFTLREIPDLGNTVWSWTRGGFADAAGANDWINGLVREMFTDRPRRPDSFADEKYIRANAWAAEKPGRDPSRYPGD